MQKFLSVSLLLPFVTLAMSSCSRSDVDSSLKDLSYAFPSEGQDRLIWFNADTNEIQFARCKSANIAVRKNCTTEKSFKEEAVIELMNQAFQSRILELRRELATVISQSFAEHPAINTLVVQSKLIDMERSQIQNDRIANQTKSKKIGDQIAQIELEITLYKEQLAQITAHLGSPNPESFLIEQKATLERELSNIQENKAELQDDIGHLASEMQNLNRKIDLRDRRSEELKTAMIDAMDSTMLSDEAIDAINGKISNLEKLNGIVPQVLDYVKRQDLTIRSQFLKDNAQRVAKELFINPRLWPSRLEIDFSDNSFVNSIEHPWNLAREDGVDFIRIGDGTKYSENIQQSFSIQNVPVSQEQRVNVSITSRVETEAGYDQGFLQYMTDDGSWLTLNVFEGNDYSWSTKTFTVENIQSGALKLRIGFVSDSANSMRGWDIDSVKITVE